MILIMGNQITGQFKIFSNEKSELLVQLIIVSITTKWDRNIMEIMFIWMTRTERDIWWLEGDDEID